MEAGLILKNALLTKSWIDEKILDQVEAGSMKEFLPKQKLD